MSVLNTGLGVDLLLITDGRKGAVLPTAACCGWGFLGCAQAAVSLLGGDGVSLDWGSEEGRPHCCFPVFEVTCLAGCAQSAFLEQFVIIQEYKCVLFFDQLLLTTASGKSCPGFELIFIHCGGALWARVAHLGCQLSAGLALPEHNTATFRVPFLGGVHLSAASVYIGSAADLLEVSPVLVCP